MAAGVASGLQNRFGVRKASRVGSIPTRSRRTSGAGSRRGLGTREGSRRVALIRVALPLALLANPLTSPRLSGQEVESPVRPGAITVDSLAADSAAVDSLAAGPPAGSSGVAPVSTQAAAADSAGPSAPVGPMGAFFRSLILPGWGQVSVDQPGRGAFYFAMEAGSLWMLFKTNAKLNAARKSNPRNEDLIAAREAQFEDWAALAVFWALFSGVDAWVSAQLWDFKGEVVPPPDGSPGAAFQYSVPIGP